MSALFFDEGPPANGRKVMLATTAYENPAACYTFAIARSREALHQAGITTAYLLLSGDCHVDDARNKVAKEFLLSDCTELVFLDADVFWEPGALVELCQIEGVDIVGGVYPFRREGEQERMPLVMYPDAKPDERGLLEVAGLPTGFMRISRKALETLSEKALKFWDRTERRAQTAILFERAYLDGLRLGGDLNFCRKWVETGGLVYAAVNLRLGHAAHSVIYDSLAAYLRRLDGSTLAHLVARVRENGFAPQAFAEARKKTGNVNFTASDDVLSLCALVSQKADGPIIESGSGLSSVVLGAATKERVFCLEHDEAWAARTESFLKEAGLTNVSVIRCPVRDGWYDVDGLAIPSQFSVALNDGPPRQIGNRMRFFDHYGDTPSIICDDADDRFYGDQLQSWSVNRGRRIDFIDRAAIIRSPDVL